MKDVFGGGKSSVQFLTFLIMSSFLDAMSFLKFIISFSVFVGWKLKI